MKAKGDVQGLEQGRGHRTIDTNAQILIFCLAEVLQHAADVHPVLLNIAVTLHRVVQPLVPGGGVGKEKERTRAMALTTWVRP